MNWINQKKGSMNCGQIALSHLTGVPYKRIIKMVGHDTSTHTTELAKVLRKLGYKCHNRLRAFKKNKPQLAIAKITIPHSSNWHWVAVVGNKIYDGANGNRYGKAKWKKGWRITSYLPVEKRKG